MEFDRFDIDGPVLFVPNRHRDPRGTFAETFREDEFRAAIGDVIPTCAKPDSRIGVPFSVVF